MTESLVSHSDAEFITDRLQDCGVDRFFATVCRLRRSHHFSEFLNFSHPVVKIGRDLQETMCPYLNRLFHSAPRTPQNLLYQAIPSWS
jgi:hypothetical protein